MFSHAESYVLPWLPFSTCSDIQIESVSNFNYKLPVINISMNFLCKSFLISKQRNSMNFIKMYEMKIFFSERDNKKKIEMEIMFLSLARSR